MYSIKEAAACLQVTPRTIGIYVHDGQLVPPVDGLFKNEPIDAIRAKKDAWPCNIVKRHRQEIIELIQSGETYDQVGKRFNLKSWDIGKYFAGKSLTCDYRDTPSKLLDDEYIPPIHYKLVQQALNIVVKNGRKFS